MALKALLLKKRLDEKRKALETLRAKDAEFETRESELSKAIEEMTEENTAEEREAVEGEVAAFDADRIAHEDAKTALEREIGELENDLKEEEEKQDTTPVPHEERKETKNMNTRDKIFGRMTISERDAFFARDDVKNYINEIRSCIREKRALQNVGLTIPTVMLGILRENVLEYSKLYKHVTVRPVSGEGRAVIMGAIPEAVWTDCCANLNELDLSFNDLELDCWKVGGYFAVCNANIEDSDIDIAAEVMTALGQAIGRALDKAILYGTGTRMPLGIVPRLAQTSEPGSYPATARPWVDLHTSNIHGSISATGIGLFQSLVTNFGDAKGKYSRGEIVHVMNEKTYTFLMAQAMSINANGMVVTGVAGEMPVVGGVIEVLDFVPDYNIVSGYFDLYMLAERAGAKFASSEHVRFLADQTVFKGTARYDGAPAIAEAFVVNAINSQSAAGSLDFTPDAANAVEGIMINTATATVAVGSKIKLSAITFPGTGTVEWTSATPGKATVGQYTGEVTGVATGSSVITASCNGKTASCTVTVTA